MKVFKLKEAESFQTSEGMMTPLFANEKVAVTHLEIPKGLNIKPHSHQGDGILILTKGSIKLTCEDPATLEAGDMAYVPGCTEVGLECGVDSAALLLSVPSKYRDVKEFRDVLRKMF